MCWNGCSRFPVQAAGMVLLRNKKKGAASDGGPPPAPTKCDISGVGVEWDSDLSLRERVRDGGPVLHPQTPEKQEDNKVCMKNADILMPLLVRMAALPNRPLPTMDDLRDEVAAFLTLNKRDGPECVGMVELTVHTLKKLLGFIKAKTRRHEVSTAPRPGQIHLGLPFSIQYVKFHCFIVTSKKAKRPRDIEIYGTCFF